MGQTLPDFDTFKALARGRDRLVPMFRRVMADQITPVLAYRRLVQPDPRQAPSFLFESVVGGDRIGRFSFIGAQPAMSVTARGHEVTITGEPDSSLPPGIPPGTSPGRNTGSAPNARTFHSEDPLAHMHQLTQDWQLATLPAKAGLLLPSFTGGWVGYAGYDTVRYLEGEKLPSPPPDDRDLPDLQMHLYLDVVAFDNVQKSVLVITHVRPQAHDGLEAAYEAGQRRLQELVDRIETPLPTGPGKPELTVADVDLSTPPPPLPESNLGDGGYQQAVRQARKYIAAGDIFQVVPSQRFDIDTTADPFDIYRSLRVVNPSPYMFYLQAEGVMLVGSSPEILCRVEGRRLTNRPLAGTRPRGGNAREDAALESELLADPKERAEHIMLVDLARNDVGRVAEPGSVQLPQVMAIERYSHVMHISSTVTGQLRPGLTCWDALRYSLPVGTVSGAPKVRAMQIIDELENRRRGPYAGAVGYVDFAGDMDMAIALRTMVVLPGASSGKWKVCLQAGAGIVADSDPDSEHRETVNKAAALAKAVSMAEVSFRG